MCSHVHSCETCRTSDNCVHLFKMIDVNDDFEMKTLEALHMIEEIPQLNKQLKDEGISTILNIF